MGSRMAQLVRCLLCKHEALNPVPRTHIKSGVWWLTLATQYWEGRKTEGSLGFAGSQASRVCHSKFSEQQCLKTGGGEQLRTPHNIDLWPSHLCSQSTNGYVYT